MKRVLLVDDDPDILDSLTLLLELTYVVTAAEDGAVALELVEKQTFDVVVLDLMMPVLDGTRFLKELRNRDIQVPVILISAHRNLDSHEAQHRALGAFASLRKPFDIQELERRLEEALARGGPEGGSSGAGGSGNGMPPPRGPTSGGQSTRAARLTHGPPFVTDPAQCTSAGGWPSSTHRLVVSSQVMGKSGSNDDPERGCLQTSGSRTVMVFPGLLGSGACFSHRMAGNTPTAS
jgi:DNA-binding response OmpR family regulator